jgi:hypothetical protein
MNPINVIATFNTLGEIKPLYVQIEINLKLRQLKIIDCKSTYNTRYHIEFDCVLENSLKIKLAYYFESHLWRSNIIII